MKGKWVTVILTILCAASVAGAAFVYVSKDRKGPEIMVPSAEIYYDMSGDTTELMEGVKAFDDEDGDVSDSLMIEGIYLNNSNTAGKVVYAAKDSNNNVMKMERTVIVGAETEEETETETELITEAETEEETETETETEEEIHKDMKIGVVNASDSSGVATRWSDYFKKLGYENISAGSSAELISTTTIYYKDPVLMREIKALIPGAKTELGTPKMNVDISTSELDICVVISGNDTTPPEN